MNTIESIIRLSAYFEVMLSQIDIIRNKLERDHSDIDMDDFKNARSILWNYKHLIDKKISPEVI